MFSPPPQHNRDSTSNRDSASNTIRAVWPTQISYQEAIEYPSLCFTDPELRVAQVANRTPFGMPLPFTGQFTNVYHMILRGGGAFAVRLFLREDTNRAAHWEALQTHLLALPDLPLCLAPVQYQAEGFRLRGHAYPMIKMPWLRGVQLNLYVERNLYSAPTLVQLAENWRHIMGDLERVLFTHGDLQHGNVLVEEETGTISLVDYDASYVPALAGMANLEAGHPSYQHPKRSPADYGPLLDTFSARVIYTALCVVAAAPELWFRLDNGDNLLFSAEDFRTPETSRAFTLIHETLRHRPDIRALVRELQEACTYAPTRYLSISRRS